MAGATKDGTESFRSRMVDAGVAEKHFREVEGLMVSSIGFGTYLGDSDEETDDAYRASLLEATRRGCNVFDTAANYRCQRSERVIGDVLERLTTDGVSREEIVVATKAGYVPFDGAPPEDVASYLRSRFVEPGVFQPSDIVSGSHVLTPDFLRDQIDQSLKNLKLETIDVLFLHNPEAQLGGVDRSEFAERVRRAFEVLEAAADASQLRFYGVATWSAFREATDAREFVSVEELVSWARDVAGDRHRFRFVQLPYSLAMTEAFTLRNQRSGDSEVSLVAAADELGLDVWASASLAQGGLCDGLPSSLDKVFPGLATDAQRALQFVRSTPGMGTALVGMRDAEHVRENLELTKRAPASIEQFLKLFDVDSE